MRLASAFLLIAACGLPRDSVAQWSDDGIPVCGMPCRAGPFRTCSDGAGGVYVAWMDTRNYSVSEDDLYLQRITAEGQVAPGWPVTGLPICTQLRTQYPGPMTHDGSGGVLLSWYDGRNAAMGNGQDLYAQRVMPDGTIAPGWQVEGTPVVLELGFQGFQVIGPDGAGGAFIVWVDERDYATSLDNIYAQHLTAAGEVAIGWPVNGLPICSAGGQQGGIVAIPDGSGGVVAGWGDGRVVTQVESYAQRINADGSIPPEWTTDGVLVAPMRNRPYIAPDDAGGFYIGCSTIHPTYFTDVEYFVERFTLEGRRVSGWPEGGVRVCAAPEYRDDLRVAADGRGGLLMAWYDYRDQDSPTASSWIQIYATRMLPDGTIAPGWTLDGTRVSDETLPGFYYGPKLAPDGAGGAYLTWAWDWNGARAQVQHLDASGMAAPGWSEYGRPVTEASQSQWDPDIVADGSGEAIVVWLELGGTVSRRGLFARKFFPDGPTPTLVSLVSAEADPDQVLLTWHGAGLGSLPSTVYRRTAESDWQNIGTPQADGSDRARFEDRSIVPGGRYAYRLGYVEDGAERFTTETWVDVPRPLAFALEGLRPNPASGAPSVAFTLPDASAARLELLDVSGRRLMGREVGSLGPGRHMLRLDGSQLSPGVVLVRLVRAGDELVARGAIVR